nr:hypothetical protein [Gaetbulibacter sp. 4G1]
MKKLSLKSLKLEANDMLQRNQLRTIFGGYVGGYGSSCKGNSCSSSNLCSSQCICKYDDNQGTSGTCILN